MQADVERSKDRYRARETYATAVLMHDLTYPLAAGIAFERVHLSSYASQVTLRECSAKLDERRAVREELLNCLARALASHRIEAPGRGRARRASYHGLCLLAPDAQERDADALP